MTGISLLFFGGWMFALGLFLGVAITKHFQRYD